MLSSLFSSVLSKVLRKYFKGFESRNIKFSLSGEVDLLDLELEETALDDLHLPLKIKNGKLYFTLLPVSMSFTHKSTM